MAEDKLDLPLASGANISVTSLQNPTLITSSQSEEYQHRLADVSSRATVSDALNILFQQDKTGDAVPITADLLYKAVQGRIQVKVKAGASIVEAAGFAALVCWEPPEATAKQSWHSEEEIDEIATTRPVFAQFLRDMQDCKIRTLGKEQKYWNMSLMARDPLRKDKGAVRAVIEPYVARARKEGVPIWLVAANERARDVYQYFGFRVVGIVWSYPKGRVDGDGQKGVPTWCMVCNWPVEKV
ncbi:hypothetical protein LTS07_007663 [Exophiala sideris]|uniref:N-acetyltransferase domain-containing protein n=1 Tax=Exophiala sideris TaxID=1016849 RepID=A0ABR0JA04_9EURO|nr:hypothetical protein LTS07_007663 [Exophiala sideris]KAK5032392.1 hypothetical protein LTR13_007215 [Exophiala sideris]KAK5059548.1 hypothetical protein LTR69_006137 [Exophiala sideris]